MRTRRPEKNRIFCRFRNKNIKNNETYENKMLKGEHFL